MTSSYQEPETGVPPVQPEVVPDGGIQRDQLAKREPNDSVGFTYRVGPLPPDELREYEELVPGFAERYLNEVLEGARHDREIEKEETQLQRLEIEQEDKVRQTQEKLFYSNQRRSFGGMIAGSVIMLFAIGCATYLGLNDREATAVGIVGSLSAAAAVAYGTDAFNRRRRKELGGSEDDSPELPEGNKDPQLPDGGS